MSPPEAALGFFFFAGAFWVLRPVAAAVARRIGGEAASPRARMDDDAVLNELQSLRQSIEELSERMDFAERLLAKQCEAPRLGSPG